MKNKHFFAFAVVIALVLIGASCSKPSENNIVGKWQLVSYQYRDSSNTEWREFVESNETIVGEFHNDGKVIVFKNGKLDYETIWSYNDGVIMFDHFDYNMEEFSSKKMVWVIKKSDNLSDDDPWFEERRIWEKTK